MSYADSTGRFAAYRVLYGWIQQRFVDSFMDRAAAVQSHFDTGGSTSSIRQSARSRPLREQLGDPARAVDPMGDAGVDATEDTQAVAVGRGQVSVMDGFVVGDSVA